MVSKNSYETGPRHMHGKMFFFPKFIHDNAGLPHIGYAVKSNIYYILAHFLQEEGKFVTLEGISM